MERARPHAPVADDASPAVVLPTTLLTGFLGSGKTTLLRRALGDPRFTDTAVIVNEVGAVAIDHYLVDFVEGAVLELPGGCLCCAVREDVARTLRDLIERRDAGEVRPFRRIVIETSGLADPAPILYTLGADPMLDARLSLGRMVTVVDAEHGAATLTRFAEAARQAAMADAIVVSKTDLAPVSDKLEAAVTALNPNAERLISALPEAPSPPPGAEKVGMRWGIPEASEHAHLTRPPLRGGHPLPPMGGEGRWRRASDYADILFGGRSRPVEILPAQEAVHTHGIDSFTVILRAQVTRLDFARALGALAGACGSDLLRVKGIVAFADRDGQPALVQAAQHTMFAPEWLDDWPDADRRSRLVFVVHDIPRAEILAHFAFAAPTVIRPQASRLHADETPALHSEGRKPCSTP